MTRVKRGIVSRRKHKKVLKQTKGYRMTRHRLIKVAKEAALHAGQYAYIGRKLRKRDVRRLWILRISEAIKSLGWSYSQFIHAAKEKKVELNRKILADLVVNEPRVFKEIVKKLRTIEQ